MSVLRQLVDLRERRRREALASSQGQRTGSACTRSTVQALSQHRFRIAFERPNIDKGANIYNIDLSVAISATACPRKPSSTTGPSSPCMFVVGRLLLLLVVGRPLLGAAPLAETTTPTGKGGLLASPARQWRSTSCGCWSSSSSSSSRGHSRCVRAWWPSSEKSRGSVAEQAGRSPGRPITHRQAQTRVAERQGYRARHRPHHRRRPHGRRHPRIRRRSRRQASWENADRLWAEATKDSIKAGPPP